MSKKIKKTHILFLIIIVAAFIFLNVWKFHYPKTTILLKDELLYVLVAKTAFHHKKGLSGRADLGEYDGMLFLFSTAEQHPIWMKDMEFPIDIVWLYRNEVVDIASNVQVETVPEAELTRYYPRTDAAMVLELPAGWTAEHELKLGDILAVNED